LFVYLFANITLTLMQLPLDTNIAFIFKSHRINHTKNFFLIVSLFIEKKTCCLAKCASFKSGVQYESNYKKLLRFFGMEASEKFVEAISSLIVFTVLDFFYREKTCYFVLDRTNWKIGKFNINPLFIGIVLGSFYVPICWISLNKRGNSSLNERVVLVDKLIKLIKFFNFKHEMVLLGDREFVGDEWFEYLHSKHITFVMRLRINMYKNLVANQLKKNPKNILTYIQKQIKRRGYFRTEICINNQTFYYIGLPNTNLEDNSPFVCFISDKYNPQWVENAYKKRWNIEVFFKHVKTNGFNLEDMNLVQMEKIQLMVAVVSYTYVICIREGKLAEEKKVIPIKRSSKTGKTWKSESLFRLGLRKIEEKIPAKNSLVDYIMDILHFTFALYNIITNKLKYYA
jgi:Transposase DDE domain